MTKFTKGPWVAKGANPSRIYGMVREDKESMVAATGSVNADSGANAHLIAAAPDMYTEITHLIHELNFVIEAYNKKVKDPSEFFDAESCHKAQVLLAKARGEL